MPRKRLDKQDQDYQVFLKRSGFKVHHYKPRHLNMRQTTNTQNYQNYRHNEQKTVSLVNQTANQHSFQVFQGHRQINALSELISDPSHLQKIIHKLVQNKLGTANSVQNSNCITIQFQQKFLKIVQSLNTSKNTKLQLKNPIKKTNSPQQESIKANSQKPVVLKKERIPKDSQKDFQDLVEPKECKKVNKLARKRNNYYHETRDKQTAKKTNVEISSLPTRSTAPHLPLFLPEPASTTSATPKRHIQSLSSTSVSKVKSKTVKSMSISETSFSQSTSQKRFVMREQRLFIEENNENNVSIGKMREQKAGSKRSLNKRNPSQHLEPISEEDSPNKQDEYTSYLLQTLPSRNPQTVHAHNQIPWHSVDILKLARSYFLQHLTPSLTSPAFQFLIQTFQSCRNCRTIVPPVHHKIVKLKRNFEYTNKKILILDLDETLVHSQSLNQAADRQKFPQSFNFDNTKRHFAIRPYAVEFLQSMSRLFYIVVFTSSVQGYADHILHRLDPEQKLVQHRFYRHNCFLQCLNAPYIKDLRILNKDLSQVLIVDNALYAYWFHPENGIPILPFTADTRPDRELIKLESYLRMLQNVDDVRPINKRVFWGMQQIKHVIVQTPEEEIIGKEKDFVSNVVQVWSEQLRSFDPDKKINLSRESETVSICNRPTERIKSRSKRRKKSYMGNSQQTVNNTKIVIDLNQ